MPRLPAPKYEAPPATFETYAPGSWLAWFDDAPKTTPAQRLSDAREAFEARYGVAVNVAICHPLALPDVLDGITVTCRTNVGLHTVWVGREEAP